MATKNSFSTKQNKFSPSNAMMTSLRNTSERVDFYQQQLGIDLYATAKHSNKATKGIFTTYYSNSKWKHIRSQK